VVQTNGVPAGIGQPAAVDRKRNAVDETAACGIGQEHDRGRTSAAVAKRACGTAFGGIPIGVRATTLVCHVHFCFDPAGTSGIDANTAPHSAARVLVRPNRPCLLALYATRSAIPASAAMDATLTMDPCPACSIIAPIVRHSRNGPVRFTSITRRHSSGVVSSAAAMLEIPALLTSTSTLPYRMLISRASASTSACDETSPVTASAWVE
jgi:hypothetical protein